LKMKSIIKPPMKGLTREHINLFFEKQFHLDEPFPKVKKDKGRAMNHANNMLREDALVKMVNEPSFGMNDDRLRSKWSYVGFKLRNILRTLCPAASFFTLTKMAGMTNNYDFISRYWEPSGVLLKEVKLEFKHNHNSIKNLCQFLELYDGACKTKYGMMETSYSEFYYDKYLEKYLGTDPELMLLNKPSKEEYLRNVADIKYTNPFFRSLYQRKMSIQNTKTQIVKHSMKEYLLSHAPRFNFDKIKEKIVESQSDKHFLMWDGKDFHLESPVGLDTSTINMSLKSIDGMCFVVDVKHFCYDIKVRLNWGNNNGIANPRWKFSFEQK